MEKYTNLQELGQGAFGKVYKAERQEDGSTHALKCLTVDSIDKGQVVLKEIYALMQIGKHPNILQFTDIFTEGAGLNTPVLNVWLALDYCNGGSLDSFIFRDNPNRATLLQLLCDTTEGVAYLHGRNVVHGSFKPDNILVDNSGQRPIVKIADFGLVRVWEQGGWDVNSYYKQADNNAILYLSPEIIGPLLAQRLDFVRYTAKADVFAFGLIIAAILDQTTSTDQAVPSTDPATPATDPSVPASDPTVTASDPTRPGKSMPVVFVNGQVTAVADVMITHPEYPVADMLMTSEPPGSPVKTLVLAMLAADPHQRPTSEQVLGTLRQITGSSARTNIQAVPPRPSYTVVEVPAEDAVARSCKDDCISCCADCWMCEKGYKWYNCYGKGWGWVILLCIFWILVLALIVWLCLVGKGDKVQDQCIGRMQERR
ncbi:serine/threonine-protein kinase pdik1l-B-like [Branchiostoma lanceolatum]|uniref:serine/threonine-protein kinase pdik1l-B-like n=1 Tax=Branchiostoma lanceolatum TaxID=7740 RepID=UPI003456DFA9